MKTPKKTLSVFSLVMINVIAVDSLRTLPISAHLGLSLVFYYLVAAFAFFIPVGLVATELATAYPNTGGIYIWVREAFGKRSAFITIWLQWIYNVVWYPTIMAFIAANLAYLFDANLAGNKYYLLWISLIFFWLFTGLNALGMRVSSWVSTLGALLGTLLPMLGIIMMGSIWFIKDYPLAVDLNSSWIPDVSEFSEMSLLSGVLFGLIGLEMSAVHAEEIRNPQRDYPRSIFYSTIIIFLSLVLSSLAIVFVVPQEKLSMVSAFIDAYVIFFDAFHAHSLVLVIVWLIVLGSLSGVSAWIIGPTKGLLVCARDGALPNWLSKTNKQHVPINLLWVQAFIFSILTVLFVCVDSIHAAYWFLSDLSAQMALMVYILMFAAAIKLRYSEPHRTRSYRIPGGNWVMWLVAGIGILCCTFTIAVGFIPPSQLNIGMKNWFAAYLLIGLTVFIAIPWLWYTMRKNK
jgi:amino acid transporter